MNTLSVAINDAVYHDALHEINLIRGDQGKSPLEVFPPGSLADCFDCPVKRALGCESVSTLGLGRDRWFARWEPEGQRYMLPSSVGEFIERFDAGRYPDLVVGRSQTLRELVGTVL